jgi:uncharacterized membrane protein YkvA (DUF1232 family)
MNNPTKKKQAIEIMDHLKTTDDSQVDSNKLETKNTGALTKVWKNVQILYKLSKSKHVPTSVKATAIGALLYVILPIDAIPDITPFFGYVDDAAIVTTAIVHLKSFIDSKEGQLILKTSKDIIKQTAYKGSIIFSDFISSQTGKEIIKSIKQLSKESSDITTQKITANLSKVLNSDQTFGSDFFSSQEGRTLLDVDGEVIIEEFKDHKSIQSMIKQYGEETVTFATKTILKIVKEQSKKTLTTK